MDFVSYFVKLKAASVEESGTLCHLLLVPLRLRVQTFHGNRPNAGEEGPYPSEAFGRVGTLYNESRYEFKLPRGPPDLCSA